MATCFKLSEWVSFPQMTFRYGFIFLPSSRNSSSLGFGMLFSLNSMFATLTRQFYSRPFGEEWCNNVDYVEAPKHVLDLPLDIQGTACEPEPVLGEVACAAVSPVVRVDSQTPRCHGNIFARWGMAAGIIQVIRP